MAERTTTILNGPEDWDLWCNQLGSRITQAVWTPVDPDQDAKPLEEPTRPLYSHIRAKVTSFRHLFPGGQEFYEHLHRLYLFDHACYTNQQEEFRCLREFMWSTVSKSKQRLLDHRKSPREWFKTLKEHTK